MTTYSLALALALISPIIIHAETPALPINHSQLHPLDGLWDEEQGEKVENNKAKEMWDVSTYGFIMPK